MSLTHMQRVRVNNTKTGFEEYWYKRYNPHAEHPYMMTLFSAPNYCDKYGNTGAYLEVGLSGA